MGLYADIVFPDPPENRPYAFINMVTTIDGKIVSGGIDEPVMDLGSKVDHATLRNLENAADAILIGAGTVRATPKMWFASGKRIVIVSGSASLPWENRVFTDAPELVTIITNDPENVPKEFMAIPLVDGALGPAMQELRRRMEIRHLVVEGGSQLNGAMLRENLIDELFLTLAPKIKLGNDLPNYANGPAFLRGELPEFELVQVTPVLDEVFLRYRRKK